MSSSRSPLEGLIALAFGVSEMAVGWHTAIGLLLAASLLGAWLAARQNPEGRRFGGAILFLAASFAIDTLLPWLPRQRNAALALRAIAMLCFFFGLIRALVVYIDYSARRRRAHFSTIFRDLLTIALYGVVILVVLRVTVAVDVTPLLATSALVTAVVGLALQETLGNVFSGLSLQLQKPFEPGDWVRFGAHLGRVLGIGWRSTALMTRSLELLDVPNSLLAREVITNYRGGAVGDELFVGVVYGTPPNRVKEVVLDVLRQVPDIARNPPPQVWVVDYGDFAIKYRIRFWMVDYSLQDQVRDQVMTAMWYAFRRSRIEIPFPIRTLYMHDVTKAAEHVELAREQATALRQVDFLRALSDEELAVLAPAVREAVFGSGETVCREGEAGDSFFVVLRGVVEVVARAGDGRETHVADLAPPAVFGEMSLLTGEARSATVRARSDARLLVVERDGFERLFQSRPDFAETVSEMVARRQTELRERRERVSTAESAETRSRKLLARMQSIFRF